MKLPVGSVPDTVSDSPGFRSFVWMSVLPNESRIETL